MSERTLDSLWSPTASNADSWATCSPASSGRATASTDSSSCTRRMRSWLRTTQSTRASRSTEPLVDFMKSGPVVAVIASGEGVIRGFRCSRGPRTPPRLLPAPCGATSPGDWGGKKVQKNIVHGSISVESAEREIGIWFPANA